MERFTEEFSVRYRNGYSANSPTAEARISLSIGKGEEEWGAEPNKEYYVQRVLEIKEVSE